MNLRTGWCRLPRTCSSCGAAQCSADCACARRSTPRPSVSVQRPGRGTPAWGRSSSTWSNVVCICSVIIYCFSFSICYLKKSICHSYSRTLRNTIPTENPFQAASFGSSVTMNRVCLRGSLGKPSMMAWEMSLLPSCLIGIINKTAPVRPRTVRTRCRLSALGYAVATPFFCRGCSCTIEGNNYN